jgi:hypothetical protein
MTKPDESGPAGHDTFPAPRPDPRHRPGGARDDAGTVTAFTVVLTAALLACAGLVLDGGLALATKVQAVGDAQEAARAGAQAIDLTAFRRQGTVALQPEAAAAAARAYLATAGATGTVRVVGDQVTVSVERERPVQILGMLGIGPFHITATATAIASRGPIGGPA